MLEGRIKTYHSNRGFGFIRPDSGDTDVFFHLKSLRPGVIPEAGVRVSYNLAPDQRSGKLQAVSVKLVPVSERKTPIVARLVAGIRTSSSIARMKDGVMASPATAPVLDPPTRTIGDDPFCTPRYK
jgi:CspA family cold shock protein